MARPRLSVVGVTYNSGDRLERWAALAREYADEIALLVDDSSDDDTLEVARRVADRVRVVEHPPVNELTMDHSLRLGDGEWLLYLDDDEMLGPSFAGVLDDLLSDRDVTHYWQPERWVVRRPGGGYGWLRSFPWYPDHHLRLMRGIGGVYSHRGRLHSPIEVAGEGRVLDDPSTAIYHLHFVLRGRKERERRIDRYQGYAAPSCEEYYLWEDYASSVEIEPLDASILDHPVGAEAMARVERAAARMAPLEGPTVPVGKLRRDIARHWDNAEVYAAEYECLAVPAKLLANRGYNASIGVRNTSDVRWRTTGGDGRIELAYHWVHADHGVLLRDGDPTMLPGTLEAGKRVVVPAGFWTPYEPGRYELQWDLRSAGRNWFSERGVDPLRIEIEIAPGERLLATPRVVARLPRRVPAVSTARAEPTRRRRWGRHVGALLPPSALRRAVNGRPAVELPPGTNLVPLIPIRVADTRDGTGVPGTPIGPVPVGSVIDIEVVADPGIPDTAIGIVAELSVCESDFAGYLSVYPAGVVGVEGTVSLYFGDDGKPTVNQVVAALGTGTYAGLVSIRVNGNGPGGVQFLLDVVAYLD